MGSPSRNRRISLARRRRRNSRWNWAARIKADAIWPELGPSALLQTPRPRPHRRSRLIPASTLFLPRPSLRAALRGMTHISRSIGREHQRTDKAITISYHRRWLPYPRRLPQSAMVSQPFWRLVAYWLAPG